MFYTGCERHIGGEGRAKETGIPPTPSPGVERTHLQTLEMRQREMHDLGSAQKPPARPQTVTPGSIRDPTPTTVTAFREFPEPPPTQGAAMPKSPLAGAQDLGVLSCSVP